MKAYRVLAYLPFDSSRKRMSLLIQAEFESPILFCKGADSVLEPRTVDYSQDDIICEYARAGLRTLVFTSRVIPSSEFDVWLPAYQEDAAALANRDDRIAARAEEIECRLEPIGVSAVEDRLQPEVPKTIRWLREAGLKVWMLTGDKLETAIAIGRTSGIIRQRSDVLVVAAEDNVNAKRRLETILEEFGGYRAPILVISDRAVEYCLSDSLDEFMAVADKVTAVILARVSPFMKAQLVSTVREHGALTLAIGDGANDVGMIQVAHVGIGVYGREGSQAAQCSDYAIPRFRHLIKLLAIHGHWSFSRLSIVVLFLLYKNMVFNLHQTWFSLDTMWSPSPLFADFFLSAFNLIFTIIPPAAFSGWDQDLPEEVLMTRPSLYAVVYNPVSPTGLIGIGLLSLWQSAVCYFALRWTMENETVQATGMACYVTCVYMVDLQILLWSHTLCSVSVVLYTINILIVPLVCYLYMAVFSTDMKGDLEGPLSTLPPWLGAIVALVGGLFPGFVFQSARNRFFPSKLRLVQEKIYAYGLDSVLKTKLAVQMSVDAFGSELRRESMGRFAPL
jgi:phospholipid-translocating P-type ATPase (flippase)